MLATERTLTGILPALLVAVAGCDASPTLQEAEQRVRSPVVEWCAEGVAAGLAVAPQIIANVTSEQLPEEIQFVRFDSRLRDYPDPVGYIELASSTRDRSELLSLARAFTSACETNMHFQLDLGDPVDVQHLVQIHEAMIDGSNVHDFGDGQLLSFDPDSVRVVIGENTYISLLLRVDVSGR